ncbi:Histone-lysine N-methyltransferase [Melia azedarach]|uniref:Histone-lysine N-methyltransferase n=1 Tax=Melia azedarach TaxID=155640 RepID=A0ACC1WND2_MELAZ|nr:Histone-lysine N-methyltransferase [Melia azedarach]
MRGIGGPLLTIGDLLSDVGEENVTAADNSNLSSSSSIQNSDNTSHSLDLTKLFQENYNELNEAFAGSDHSWTALTLKLCTALETANKLVQSTNTNVTILSEKVLELEKVVKREESAIVAAKAINVSLNQKKGLTVDSQHMI